MLKPENQVDKDRFEKLKDTELDHGRAEETAIDVAAKQVKELREREAVRRTKTRTRHANAVTPGGQSL